MEVHEILEELKYNKGRFPRVAVREAVEKREAITPPLLRIIEETTAHAEEVAEDHGYIAHLYSLYLLAQFREPRAYPLIVKLFSLPGDVCDRLTGDFITEALGRVLASVARGDARLVKELIENRNASVWVRMDALRSIAVMVGAGELPREEALAYFQALLRDKLEREETSDNGWLWGGLVSTALDLYPEGFEDDLRRVFEEGLVYELFITLDHVERRLREGKDVVLKRLPRLHPLITDTIEEMEWWACFEEDYKERQRRRSKESRRVDPAWERGHGRGLEQPVAATIVREAPKVGRNEPCPCGSGKKHKRCCGAG